MEEGSAIGSGANPAIAFLENDYVPAELRDFSVVAMYDIMSRQMSEKVARAAGIHILPLAMGRDLLALLVLWVVCWRAIILLSLIAYRKQKNWGRPA